MPGYGSYRTGVIDGTDPSPKKIPGHVNGGNACKFIEKFDLSQSNVLKNAGQNNVVCDIPENHAPLSIKVSSSVDLTTSQLKFGTVADDDLFGTAKAYGTTPNAVVEYLLTSQRGNILSEGARLLMGITTANLPGAGIIVVEVETVTTG